MMGYSDTGTNSAVNVSASDSTSVLAANSGRRAFSVYNDGAATVYLSLGTVATTTSHTVQIVPQGYYEYYGYRGAVTHKGSSATGALRVTEMT